MSKGKNSIKPLAKARSISGGNLEGDTVLKIVKKLGDKYLFDLVRDYDLDDPESYEGGVFLHEGDLQVNGDFKVDEQGALLLIVQGDLDVSGLFQDWSEFGILIVTGNLRARDIVTSGNLRVGKNLEAEKAVIGDYNDGGAGIGGNLTCKLFFPSDHSFAVDGEIQADHIIEIDDDAKELIELFGADFEDSDGQFNFEKLLADSRSGKLKIPKGEDSAAKKRKMLPYITKKKNKKSNAKKEL